MSWFSFGPAVFASFAGTLVEFLEALTIVLAVGATRGWRSALGGAVLAACVLLLLLIGIGDEITRIPLRPLQEALGGLTLLFGMRWLQKAMLRAAGMVPLRDELNAYRRQQEISAVNNPRPRSWDREALGTTFRVTLVEGVEAVFIVLAVGEATPQGGMMPAVGGSAIALLSVCLLGFLLRRPVALIPDNTLKLGVGLCLCSLGTLWLGKGEALNWPGGDWSLLALLAGYSTTAAVGIALCRRAGREPAGQPKMEIG